MRAFALKKPPYPKQDEGAYVLFGFLFSRAAGPEIVVHRDKHQVVAGVRFRIISDDKSVRYAFDGNGHIRFVQKVAVAVHWSLGTRLQQISADIAGFTVAGTCDFIELFCKHISSPFKSFQSISHTSTAALSLINKSCFSNESS